MNKEILEVLKSRSQEAADAFRRLQERHGDLPHEQLEFNYAVLLALKAVYDAIGAVG